MPYYEANNTMTHVHHRIPTHCTNGVANNHPDNLMELPVADHAEEHKWLFIEHGREEDAIAWLGLAGYLDSAEAHRQSILIAMKRPEVRLNQSRSKLGNKYARGNKGKTKTLEHAANISAARVGVRFSPEHRANLSAVKRGKPASPQTYAALSIARKGIPLSRVSCTNCHHVITVNTLTRHNNTHLGNNT